ncbi:energy transducer TonB [Pseudomonadota bacterium]
MLKQGYARLMAALFAAITLHALLLIKTDDSTLTVATDVDGSLLQVALLPKQQQEVEQQPDRSTKPAVLLKSDEKPVLKPVEQGSGLAQRQEALPSVKALPDTALATLLPEDIQATILAHVSYPRQARRRGWEGEAEFKFNVYSQSIQHVTMLVSTGYPILDQAARRGLLSVHSLPLTDGSYRLPVVFRLQ